MERLCGKRGREGWGGGKREKEREIDREDLAITNSSSSRLTPGIILDIPALLDTLWKRTKKIS